MVSLSEDNNDCSKIIMLSLIDPSENFAILKIASSETFKPSSLIIFFKFTIILSFDTLFSSNF